jgi:hypothetical protein
METDPNAPAGWYPDTEHGRGSRFWDGSQWTADRVDEVQAKPLRTRGIWAAIAVLAVMAAGGLNGIVSLDYASVVQQQIDDGDVTLEEADDIEILFGISSVVYLLASLGGAVGFIIWFHRAHSNLRFLTQERLRYSTSQAAWPWFVPIMNLFRPKQIANDIWRGTEPGARGNRNWTKLDVGPIVHWWWAFWIFSSVVGSIAGGLISSDPVLSNDVLNPAQADSVLEDERSAAVATAVASAVQLVSGALAIVFVRQATQRQEAKMAEDAAQAPPHGS